MDMLDILQSAVKKGASDIHLIVTKPPMLRIMGDIIPLEGYNPLTAEDTKKLIYSILYDDQKQQFEEKLELDCSYGVPGLSRFRINVFLQKDGVGSVLRIISSKIPNPEQINLAPAILQFAKLQRGLVLVTGPTGSGKSTTLACLIDIINREKRCHILTIEDPIEFVYENKNSIINQREVGGQTLSFADALKHALRQDPDVILIGEMRDLETISAAITIAETGHLVFATLHTSDAAQTVDRIIDVFPPYQQQQIRMQLSTALVGVVCQQLIARLDGKGRIAAREVMVVSVAIANLIREGKTHQIYSAIDTGSKAGMISMDKCLVSLVQQKLISKEEGLVRANNPAVFRQLIGMPSVAQ
jgi:twitching motility protein PilT